MVSCYHQGTSLSRSKETLSNHLTLLFTEIVYSRDRALTSTKIIEKVYNRVKVPFFDSWLTGVFNEKKKSQYLFIVVLLFFCGLRQVRNTCFVRFVRACEYIDFISYSLFVLFCHCVSCRHIHNLSVSHIKIWVYNKNNNILKLHFWLMTRNPVQHRCVLGSSGQRKGGKTNKKTRSIFF